MGQLAFNCNSSSGFSGARSCHSFMNIIIKPDFCPVAATMDFWPTTCFNFSGEIFGNITWTFYPPDILRKYCLDLHLSWEYMLFFSWEGDHQVPWYRATFKVNPRSIEVGAYKSQDCSNPNPRKKWAEEKRTPSLAKLVPSTNSHFLSAQHLTESMNRVASKSIAITSGSSLYYNNNCYSICSGIF